MSDATNGLAVEELRVFDDQGLMPARVREVVWAMLPRYRPSDRGPAWLTRSQFRTVTDFLYGDLREAEQRGAQIDELVGYVRVEPRAGQSFRALAYEPHVFRRTNLRALERLDAEAARWLAALCRCQPGDRAWIWTLVESEGRFDAFALPALRDLEIEVTMQCRHRGGDA